MVESHGLCYFGYSLELLLPPAERKKVVSFYCVIALYEGSLIIFPYKSVIFSEVTFVSEYNDATQFKGKTKGEEGRSQSVITEIYYCLSLRPM